MRGSLVFDLELSFGGKFLTFSHDLQLALVGRAGNKTIVKIYNSYHNIYYTTMMLTEILVIDLYIYLTLGAKRFVLQLVHSFILCLFCATACTCTCSIGLQLEPILL